MEIIITSENIKLIALAILYLIIGIITFILLYIFKIQKGEFANDDEFLGATFLICIAFWPGVIIFNSDKIVGKVIRAIIGRFEDSTLEE